MSSIILEYLTASNAASLRHHGAAMTRPDTPAARCATDMTTHVLILCTHNSARSVLAEGMLNHLAARLGRDVQAHSAGSAPSGRINPFAIQALRNAGVDTGACRSKSWDEFSRAGAPPLAIVITVCDSAAAEPCPVFFGAKADGGGAPVKVHWGYPDPSNAEGGDEGKRRAFELTRQAIAYRMLQLLALPLQTMDRAALQAALLEIGRS
jgi:arsenate reductase